MSVNLLAVGSTMTDLRMLVDPADLEHAGLTPGSSNILDMEQLSSLLDRWPIGKITLGGSTANTVLKFAELGGAVDFITAIGKDKQSAFIPKQLADSGINLLSELVDGGTGLCVVFITPDGERTMAVAPRCAAHLVAPEVAPDRLPSYLLLEGYLLDYSPETRDSFYATVQWSQEVGTPLVISLSDSALVARHRSELSKLVLGCRPMLIGNESEFQALFGEGSVKRLCSLDMTAAITRGSKGATVINMDNVIDVAAEPIPASDTTGAGDAFAAGFLFGLDKGAESAARLGVDLATQHVISASVER